MERKIVKIATIVEPEFYNERVVGSEGSIIALCNDGTLWSKPNRVNHRWEQLPAIPQPEPHKF